MKPKSSRKKPSTSPHKALIAKVTTDALEPVDVTVWVKKFANIFGTNIEQDGRITTCFLDLPEAARVHKRVTLTTEKSGEQKLWIRQGGAILRFTLRTRTPHESFFPLTIAFNQLNSSGTGLSKFDVTGRRNFSFDSMRVSSTVNSLTITDRFKDRGQPNKYKFFLVIQNLNNGQIGIIDPGIEHER